MNKKGFTLVEILAVIFILGVVISIATISIMGVREKMNIQMTYEKIADASSLAATYASKQSTIVEFLDNPSNSNKCVLISWEKMIQDGFYETPDNKALSDIDPSISLNPITFCVYKKYSHYYSCIPKPSNSSMDPAYRKKNYELLYPLEENTDIETLYCNYASNGSYDNTKGYNVQP